MARLQGLLLAAAVAAQLGLVLPQGYDGYAPEPPPPPPRSSKVHRGGSKVFQPGGGRSSRYRGGCDEMPPPPMSSAIRCSTYSGCRATCMEGHLFPGGEEQIIIRCENGVWAPPEPYTEIPSCQPVCALPCLNGGSCVGVNVCRCPPGFEGRQCQTRQRQCTAPRPTVYNARMSCRDVGLCSVTCSRGYETADHRTSFDIECSEDFGWTPAEDRFAEIPSCQPICRPHCENGGRCVAFNLCTCPEQFRGPSCQWPVENCNPKTQLTFNGGYNCSGRGDQFGCRLYCPEGVPFTSPPEEVYQCDYSTGQYFPQPIPQCDFGFAVVAPSLATFIPPSVAPEPRQCTLWAGKHVKTFDGTVYSFVGGCSLTAVKDQVTSLFRLSVVRSCGEPDCPWHLQLVLDAIRLTVTTDIAGHIIVTRKQPYLPEVDIELPSEIGGVVLEETSNNMLIIKADDVGMTIHYKKDSTTVLAEPSAWGTVGGLCGTLDGNPNNDLLLDGLRATLEEHSDDGECPARMLSRELRCSPTMQSAARAVCSRITEAEFFVPCREATDVNAFYAACAAGYCHALGQSGHGAATGYYDPSAEAAARAAVCSTFAAFAAECERRTSRSISWRSADFCPLPCPEGQVFSTCGVQPSDRCGAALSEEWTCEEGCACPEGLLMDGDQCVEPTQCSCVHNGVRHPAGAKVAQDCNTCTCTSGQWVCTDAVCPSKCVVAGDPHYLTFDGVRFDYQGKCSYYLVLADDYSVQAENVPCSGAISEKMNYHPSTLSDQPSCTKSVTIQYRSVTVELKQGLQVIVDGEIPPLVPWWVSGVYIKHASTHYLSVTLPNRLEIWWDGETRAVVHSPEGLTDSLRGLCGNANGNQGDDFRTPEGDIETDVLAFASKWKVDETCDDKTQATNHPCQVYSDKYPEASELCDAMVSSPVFAECHSVLDPAPYVKNCKYDVCSCRTELKSCYCVHLADYAEACAARGVRLQWRAEVGMCGVNCPHGQQYKVCGDSCAHTCFDLATNTDCQTRCAEGCQCPDGLTLNHEGRCAPISECPCVHNNKEYRPGHRRYEATGSSPQLCECVNARWVCELAKTERVVENPATSCDASKHLVYAECLPAHPQTCRSRNIQRPESHKSLPHACEPGCVCEDGYLLDSGTGECVTSDQCPCHHGGQSYPHGKTVTTECQSCTCLSGTWACEDQECDGVCTAWGNSHYHTFDGRVFDIEGDCQYMLAKGKLTNRDQFEVIITNVPCGSGATCPKAVTIRVGQGASAEKLVLEEDKHLPSSSELTRLSLRQAGIFAFVESPGLGLVVQWDFGTRIYVRLEPRWRGKAKGLCGDFDGNPGNDFRGPSGMLENTAVQFAEQYKLQPYCPDTVKPEDACKAHPERHLYAVKGCAVLKSETFADCHALVDVQPFFESCTFDTCACTGGGDCECLCTAVAAYGQACSQRGVHIRWRTKDFCPMQCDLKCSTYSSCVSACPPKTCENRYVYEEITTMCASDTCVEGCQPHPCEPGEVYVNSSLVSCVRESECRTRCAVVDGRQLFEGDVVSKDSCHVCYCTRGRVKCRGSACPVVVSTPKPPVAPESEVCKPGWSGWVNRNRPVVYTRPNDVERIPSFIEPVDAIDAMLAVVELLPGSSDQVNGRLIFTQKAADAPLSIAGEITGLSPGKHGFHIHEKGRTTDACRDAGGHFNPTRSVHGGLRSAVRHLGDLGNIKADSFGLALVDITVPAGSTSLFGDEGVLGLALVVHAGPDDLGRGGDAGSQTTGNAGGRLACGVIRRAYDASTGPAFCADNQVTDVKCRTAGTHLSHRDTGEQVACSVQQGLVCQSSHTCQDYELQVFCDCTIDPTEEPPTEPLKPTRPPSTCATDAWTPWMSSHTPGQGDWTDTEDIRSLREEFSFCEDQYITAIECRTKLGHLDITKVGGGAVCDINHGLVCSDALGYCDDFEVRFYCNCEEPVVISTPRPTSATAPCTEQTPLEAHETDCHKFYQCSFGKKVAMSCGADLMFNPDSRVCDRPSAVVPLRPECEDTDEGAAVHCDEIHPVRAHPSDCHQYYQCVRSANDVLTEYLRTCGPHMMYNPETMTCDSVANVQALRPECEEFDGRTPPSTPPTAATTRACPLGQVYDDCRIRCDQLCHYFGGFLEARGFCKVQGACKPGCRQAGVDYQGCPAGFVWKDEERCVRVSDCNCRRPNGKPLGPGQVVVDDDGCTKLQCVNNDVQVDSSDCRKVTEVPRVSVEPTRPSLPDTDCDVWSEWIDQTDPRFGDYEVEMLPWWGDFCRGHHLESIECRVVETGAPYQTAGDVGVTCDVANGLACSNARQPSGRCHNYRVRFYCACGPPTEPPVVTTEPSTISTEAVITTVPTTPEATTTAEPPTWDAVVPPEEEHCDVERFLPLLHGDEPLPDTSFSASSTVGPEGQAANAKILDQFQDAARSWLPAQNDRNQYLQVDLGAVQPVYAVKVVGNTRLKSAVVDFQLWYSEDGAEFRPLTNEYGRPQELTSIEPLLDAEPVILPTAVTARHVRLVPLSWQQRIAVKMEVYGCSLDTEAPPTTQPPITVSTAEPPPHCDEQQFVPLLNGEQPLPDDQITASSDIPEMAAPYAKIKAGPDDALRSWVARNNDQNQYLQVDLGSVQPVYAVLVKGNKALSSSVTRFELLYSLEGNIYSYAANPMSQPAALTAVEPLGADPGLVVLPVPLEARYLRLHPTDWRTRIALKLEVYGCQRVTTPPPTTPTPPPRCMEPMGLENGLLDDSLIEVSSEISEEHGSAATRPGTAGWVPEVSNHKQFIRINFSGERTLDAIVTTGVKVKGAEVPGYPNTFEPDETRYIGSYRVRYSQDGINWIWVYNKSGRVMVFPGHSERTALSPMQNVFDQPIHAQYLEIIPQNWADDGIGATVEVLGCYHPYPEVTTTTTTEGPDRLLDCQACEGVPVVELEGCQSCGRDDWWNGTSCLDGPALCPCYYNGRPYAVGSIFDLADCQECVCQLGGKRVCERKTCPPCGGELVSQLGDDCLCQCNPCSEGTRICPTSRTCLEKEKWCDGVKQCPDDEGEECHVPETTVPPPTTKPTQPPILPQYCTLKGNTFNTFDDVEYKYQICHHTLVKEEGVWDVTVHRQCEGAECRREVRIETLGERVTLIPGVGVEYQGFTYSLQQADRLRSEVGTFKITTTGTTILFNSPDIGFAVLVNNVGNVVVGINSKHYGTVEGLCGNFDGNKYNDKQTPAGELASSTAEFGDSWALPDKLESCEPETCKHPKEAFALCQKIRLEPFSRCHSTVQPDSFISSCLETACACLDAGQDAEHCRCDALTAYVTECLSLDPSVDLSSWRTKHQCPSDCPPGEVYRDCYRPTCEPSCERLEPCDILPDLCFQGCYCPDGLVRHQGKCVDPVDCRDCQCGVYPGGEFESFDEEERVLNTNCTYLAAGRVEANGKYNFKVLVDNGNCVTTYSRGVTCSDDVRVEWASNVVLLKRTGTLRRDSVVKVRSKRGVSDITDIAVVRRKISRLERKIQRLQDSGKPVPFKHTARMVRLMNRLRVLEGSLVPTVTTAATTTTTTTTTTPAPSPSPEQNGPAPLTVERLETINRVLRRYSQQRPAEPVSRAYLRVSELDKRDQTRAALLFVRMVRRFEAEIDEILSRTPAEQDGQDEGEEVTTRATQPPATPPTTTSTTARPTAATAAPVAPRASTTTRSTTTTTSTASTTTTSPTTSAASRSPPATFAAPRRSGSAPVGFDVGPRSSLQRLRSSAASRLTASDQPATPAPWPRKPSRPTPVPDAASRDAVLESLAELSAQPLRAPPARKSTAARAGSGPQVEVFVNGAMVEGFYHEYDWGTVSQPPHGSVLLTVPGLHLEVSLHPVSGALSVRLPSKVYGGSVGGVCGNCDGSAEDEASASPSYWLLDTEDPASCVEERAVCVPPPAEDDPCQKMLDDAIFGSCHLLEDPAPFVAACQRRICDDSTHNVCDDLELYARRCYERGLCAQWRSPEMCGRDETCPPTMQYRQCTGTCLKSCEKRDCPLLEMDGCFCPEGQVFEDGVCVDQIQCNFCDEDGHRPGDTWRPDNCTTCVCRPSGSSQCTSVECPPQPVVDCLPGYVAADVPGTGTECCPARHECRLVPVTTTEAPVSSTPPTHCPDVVEPACDASQGKVVEYVTVNGCPMAVCACVPEDQCPPPSEPRQLKPGERLLEHNDTCCPVREIVCDAATCPAPPDCPDQFLLHTPADTAADCCPPQFCRQPPDTCLVRLDVAIDIRTITADNTEGFVVKRAGEVWSDGFCDNCTCREVPGGDPLYQPICVQLVCPAPPTADVQHYVYDEDDEDDDPCCPRHVRVACKDNGKDYLPGQTWTQQDGGRPVDPCVTWECSADETVGVVKVPVREKCVEDCRLGETYVPAAPGSGQCCGHCERTACVAGGVARAEGETWKSADGCTEFTCERDFFDDQLGVLSSGVLCRDVSDCPPQNLYTDETGCCQRCNRTDNCHVKVVPPPETVGMFKEGDCVNVKPVLGVVRCQGACDSMAFFDTDSGQIESGCKCCGVTATRLLDLELTCEREDGYGNRQTSTMYQTFTVPDGCACNKCDSSSTGLAGSAGAFWQQSTGEEWTQQSGEPFPDPGFGAELYPFGGAGAEDTFSRDNGKQPGFVDTSQRGALPRISDSEFFDLLVDSAGHGGGPDDDLGEGEIH